VHLAKDPHAADSIESGYAKLREDAS